MDTRSDLKTLLWESYREWSRDNVQRLGAALAYYMVFSLAPLLVIAISIVGLFFGSRAAQGLVAQQLQELIGPSAAEAVQNLLQHALYRPRSGLLATLFGLGTLLAGASAVVNELRVSLNQIWEVSPRRRGWLGYLWGRLISLAFVLFVGLLLLLSLGASIAIAAAGKYLTAFLPVPELVLQGLNILLSIGTITLLFAVIYKFLPDARISWHDVWIGALVTALLFTLGNFLLGIYLGKRASSAYGAAGSVILILLWTYYCAQIFYFGAEFTQVFSKNRGSRRPQSRIPSETR
ncbi:MAG: YihY/virulence factor BrkB family protein [Elusimicrobia bacterium]|nr:YihY/virulence factor BrkB family protein [Elusimicrobiota bacterium]